MKYTKELFEGTLEDATEVGQWRDDAKARGEVLQEQTEVKEQVL